MRYIITILIIVMFLHGCSSLIEVVTLDDSNNFPTPVFRLPQTTRWTWNASLYRVDKNHTYIERVPVRSADYHLNVNTFVEPPYCGSCLMIGTPHIQPDGSIKIKVMLSHPFPGQPYYTGFDIRGTIMFPATRYWTLEPEELTTPSPDMYEILPDDILPLYFSRAEDSGGQLLNADGYTFYLSPWLDLGPAFDAPIFNYSKGKYAIGPEPDSTINGFKLFTKDPERRMFRVTDTITRTYHIAPPEGEFIFGYVVDASWAPPTTTPVTEPKNDFPFWANCEEGYVLESEQLAPFKTGTYNQSGPPDPYDVTRMTVLSHLDVFVNQLQTYLICPEIIQNPSNKSKEVAHGHFYVKESPGVYSIEQEIKPGIYEAPPGQYLALLYGNILYNDPFHTYPVHILTPVFFDFIKLEVVEGEE